MSPRAARSPLSLEKQYKLARIFFHTKRCNFKPWKSGKRRKKKRREKAQAGIASHDVYTEFTSQTQGALSEVPWAKFVLCLNSHFCLPR
jgi:hypothetical protein